MDLDFHRPPPSPLYIHHQLSNWVRNTIAKAFYIGREMF
jgi:hypothetical protein